MTTILMVKLLRDLRLNPMLWERWKQQLNGDCAKRDAPQLQGRCDLLAPYLPKVL